MVNTAFTIPLRTRYSCGVMLLFAAAAFATLTPQTGNQPAAPAIQATATVRILSGDWLKFGKTGAGDGFRTRNAVLRAQGSTQTVKLIEFE